MKYRYKGQLVDDTYPLQVALTKHKGKWELCRSILPEEVKLLNLKPE